MNKQLEEGFDRFWQAYPHKRSKGAAEKAWEKVFKDVDYDDMFKEIMLAIDAQKRYRKDAAKSGTFIPQWKHPSTWLNQKAYLDEIPSTMEIKSQVLAVCKTEGCERQVLGPRFDVCHDHLVTRKDEPYRQQKIDYMTKHNLIPMEGESKFAYGLRCRNHLKTLHLKTLQS